MSQTLLEKHEAVIVEIAQVYLDNMAVELGKKYQDQSYQIDAGLSDDQYREIKKKHDILDNEFAELYSDFQKMKPTAHLQNVMGAFTKSGGSVDVEPVYDEEKQRLDVTVSFMIDDKSLDKIEGLSPIEDLLLRMDAMWQINTVLSGSDQDGAPAF